VLILDGLLQNCTKRWVNLWERGSFKDSVSYEYVYILTHTHTHTHTHAHTNTRTRVHTHTRTHACTHTHTCMCVSAATQKRSSRKSNLSYSSYKKICVRKYLCQHSHICPVLTNKHVYEHRTCNGTQVKMSCHTCKRVMSRL